VRCEVAALELSAQLDGEHDRRLDEDVAAHLQSCARCRAFEEGARRIRVAARVRSATPVPDLVPRIMEAIEAPTRLPRRQSSRPAWLPYAAAFVSGAVIAGLLLGGIPGLQRGPSPALATEIPDAVAAATTDVFSYRATFDITENNFHPRVGARSFTADIAFRAPERFRAHVVDETVYPAEGWTRNDFVLAIDEDRWSIDAPRTCPRLAQPACVVVGRDLRSAVGRAPFDGETALPTDIVLPVRTLVDVDRVDVVEETTVLDRDAVVVSLEYHDTTPLFAYLHAAGTWRPFFPHDQVLVTLDRETWFPLAYEVRAAASIERAAWAKRQGLPPEPTGTSLLTAVARSLEEGPSASWRAIPEPGPETRDFGFDDLSTEAIADRVGASPPLPSDTGGLPLYRSGLTGERFTVAYARGLGWLTVTGTRHGQAALPDPLAMPMDLDRGFGLYSPATEDRGRRLAIRDEEWALVLETNLSQKQLIEIASSIPIVGNEPAEKAQDLADARRALSGLLIPNAVPDAYRLWNVEARRGAATLTYLRPGSELDGTGIRLHQSAEAGLPPPLDLEVIGVDVRGRPGRYSAERAELEWIENGTYHSLQASALDLAGLLRFAESLEPAA
jgi:hypothetical protein